MRCFREIRIFVSKGLLFNVGCTFFENGSKSPSRQKHRLSIGSCYARRRTRCIAVSNREIGYRSDCDRVKSCSSIGFDGISCHSRSGAFVLDRVVSAPSVFGCRSVAVVVRSKIRKKETTMIAFRQMESRSPGFASGFFEQSVGTHTICGPSNRSGLRTIVGTHTDFEIESGRLLCEIRGNFHSTTMVSGNFPQKLWELIQIDRSSKRFAFLTIGGTPTNLFATEPCKSSHSFRYPGGCRISPLSFTSSSVCCSRPLRFWIFSRKDPVFPRTESNSRRVF